MGKVMHICGEWGEEWVLASKQAREWDLEYGVVVYVDQSHLTGMIGYDYGHKICQQMRTRWSYSLSHPYPLASSPSLCNATSYFSLSSPLTSTTKFRLITRLPAPLTNVSDLAIPSLSFQNHFP